MRRLVALVSGLAGGIAAYRLLRRRRGRPAAELLVEGPDPRAEALRAKLEQEAAQPSAGPTSEAEEPSAGDPEARRRLVHEQGRAAVEQMRTPEQESQSASPPMQPDVP